MNFNLYKTKLFYCPCGKNLPTADLPKVQFKEHYTPNNLEQRWVGVFFARTLQATLHMEKYAAKARSTL